MVEMILHDWKKEDKETLEEQLELCNSVKGKLRDIVREFFLEEEIYTLDDIDQQIREEYWQYINQLDDITEVQRKYYRNLLDQVLLAYFIPKNEKLVNEVEKIIKEKAKKNKILLILMEHGIKSCEEITYEIRLEFEDRLNKQRCVKKREYLKEMDRLKLETIRGENSRNPLKMKKLNYGNKKIFLLYHPNYRIAKSFYYVRDKNELVFDFSEKASIKMKKQIFSFLNYVLEEKQDRHDRRERFLIPLKRLYLFCCQNNIEDVELLTADQINAFQRSMQGNVGTKETTYMQIIYNLTKYLFLTADKTNWKANIWYLERFMFKDGRMNPAREIEKISFGKIEIDENRDQIKKYLKYQIGVAQRRSMQTIRCEYYDILEFLKFCDQEKLKWSDINSEDIKDYIALVDQREIQAEAYNRKIISIARFFNYVGMNKQPVYFEYYLKTVHIKHNNRTVPVEKQKEILLKLKYLPMHLRLMFLNLWAEGIRICEVCILKAGMYTWDGQDAWLKIYQNKMKKEKVIPIPKELYELMNLYIKEQGIAPDEYVFQSQKGGPYDAGTFTVQMKKEFRKVGLKDYEFKAHDFRHSIGTTLNRNYQSSIEVIREFLGHNSSDMTKQYIDFVPELLDRKNKEYFSKKENQLGVYAKRRMSDGK